MAHLTFLDLMDTSRPPAQRCHSFHKSSRSTKRAGQFVLLHAVYLLGLTLWLAYGIMLHASAVIVVNAASIVLVALAIVMKALTSTEHRGNFVRSAAQSTAAVGSIE